MFTDDNTTLGQRNLGPCKSAEYDKLIVTDNGLSLKMVALTRVCQKRLEDAKCLIFYLS
ncbi:hypothetical protein C7387_3479 [Yokenella regensburgei]|jgi:hypothetical protein|uniref:Uncharacterized protein n=1 Tax=Yokenella regensburgei TaxID=158877 RepID=A0AB38FX28_9ENTR|nr:hypothetical protein HMPREF0880_00540 [Yokenella regensburgei ATCC 43003]RKR53996.1 hypothetical protein C7387_3479 [Yokenella regensburgei]SQA63173.1 Uncharacterised protein [Yokenella regensburgei]SQA68593.1 Uncharacterised protein [Yokenella regensburgei]SUQ06908.1 Uncharacterised protein [Yokenella regensburgei]